MSLNSLQALREFNSEFFKPSVMEWFSSRVEKIFPVGEHGAVVVTSEKFESPDGPEYDGPRLYTVRAVGSVVKHEDELKRVSDLSEFQEFATSTEAIAWAGQWLKDHGHRVG